MSDSKFKAFIVTDKYSEDGDSTVVFAETRNKARVLAQKTTTCIDTNYIDIDCYRAPCFDKYYRKGKVEMNWNSKNDRIALCKEGWACAGECNSDNCSAKKYCHRYDEEYLNE